MTKLYEQEEYVGGGGGSLSSFTLEQADGSRAKIISGFIASCRFDGCNAANSSLFELSTRFFIFNFLFIMLSVFFSEFYFI